MAELATPSSEDVPAPPPAQARARPEAPRKGDRGHPWWLKTLAAMGAVALGAAILTLFFSFGRRPVLIELTANPAVNEPEFLLAVAGNAGVPIERGGTAQLLNNGDEFFPALLDALRGAQRSITWFVYIWEDGEASRPIIAALLERARAGVEVRVLLDAMGSTSSPEKELEGLRSAGAKVATFREAEFGKLTRFHMRNHRRAIVVDGAIGFTGGMAVGDKWLGHAQDEEHWRDAMVRVTGPMARGLQTAFASSWAHTTGEVLVGSQFFPDPPVVAARGEPVALSVAIASAPAAEDHPLRLLYVQTFAAARRKLYLQNSYFVPDETVRRVIRARARAGVDVRILVPGENTDAKPIRQTGHRYYEELMADGVRIYEYEPTMMHAKNVVVDGLWSVVGSANMDVRSKELNHENVIGILDAGFARQVEGAFLDDLRRSRQISLEEWRRRGPLKRFTESVSRLFAEQY
ncbi:MAG TPA: phospholipase D-like domain-containing protein [Vicinamibacteria bacterium]|nr:phospholipase D-like domain-containing protein [Vicinamibacteria bacterium]